MLFKYLDIPRFIKYSIAGVANTLISYIIYVILVYFQIHVHIAFAVGYIVGMFSSFVINSRWTFNNKTIQWKSIKKFIFTNLLILFASEWSLALTLKFISSPYLAQLINLFPIAIFGFLLNKYIVFNKQKEKILCYKD